MKGKKHKATGGAASGDPKEGEKDYDADLASKPNRRNNAPKIEGAAEEKKSGGRAKRKRGGGVKHHEKMEELGHAAHVGKIAGGHSKGHKGRAARASGGKTGSNLNPLSSAHFGSAPSGHKTTDID